MLAALLSSQTMLTGTVAYAQDEFQTVSADSGQAGVAGEAQGGAEDGAAGDGSSQGEQADGQSDGSTTDGDAAQDTGDSQGEGTSDAGSQEADGQEDAGDSAELQEQSDALALAAESAATSVTTAAELASAFANASAGSTISLGANIDFNPKEMGRLVVSRDITLDCNGFTLTVGGAVYEYGDGEGALVVNNGATLTLVNAQTVAKESTRTNATGKTTSFTEDLIEENNGTVIVKSTAGAGIHAGFFIYDNYGTLTVENGTFSVETLIDDNDGVFNVESGTFRVEDYVVSESNGLIEIFSGDFTSETCKCFDEIYSEFIIHDAKMTSKEDDCIKVYDGGDVTVYNAELTSVTSGNCFDINDGGQVTIYAGTFVAEDDCVGNWTGGFCTIYTGSFSATDDEDGCMCGSGTWIVPDGYLADPADWQTSNPSSVKFYELTIKVNFYSEGSLFSTTEGSPLKMAFPDDPAHSQGYAFCCWRDEDGNVVSDLSKLSVDTNLYAVFANQTYTVTFVDGGATTTQDVLINTPLGEVPGVDREAADDGFQFWKLGNQIVTTSTPDLVTSDLTLTAVYGSVVHNYNELKAAVERKEPGITIAGDFAIEGTVTIDYPCAINGGGHTLTRPDGYEGVHFEVVGDEDSPITFALGNVTFDGRDVSCREGVLALKNKSSWDRNGYSVYLNDVTIKNNNADRASWDAPGGASFDGASEVSLVRCKVQNNSTYRDAGGISFDHCNNVEIVDSEISDNHAGYYGGGLVVDTTIVHLRGTSSICRNTAGESGGGVYNNGGNSDDTIFYMHDNSSVTHNTADGYGGGFCWQEMSLVMEDNSSIDHNEASKDGGGVYAASYSLTQNGGVIRDNKAGECGGGAYVISSDGTRMNSGSIFDNTASEAGDDVYNLRGLVKLYSTQASRKLGEGESSALGTVSVEEIEGYYEVSADEISVPFYSWYIDGEYDGETVARYQNLTDSTKVSAANGNLGVLHGDPYHSGLKAIWYGLLLAYDANYEGTTDHQYDSQAYTPGKNATVQGCMFTREGYTFTGWNTKADGTGDAYSAEDALKMNHSQVLYAQWEKNADPTPDPDPDPDPTPDTKPEPKPEPDKTEPGKTDDKRIPQTGDVTSLVAPACAAGMAVLAAGFAARRSKKGEGRTKR